MEIRLIILRIFLTKCIIGFVVLISTQQLVGQNLYEIELHYNSPSKSLKKIAPSKNLRDTNAVKAEIIKLITNIQSQGFVEVRQDSVIRLKNKYDIFLNLGVQYEWNAIEKGNADWSNLGNLNYRFQDFNHTQFNYEELIALQESIIVSLENAGYPFASVFLDEIEIIDHKINAQLNISKGNFITIDTIIMPDYEDIRLGFIEQSIGIFIGSPYDESKVKQISKQLSRLEFAELSKEVDVEFDANTAKIILHLKPKNSNQFDGIIGFQPESNNAQKLTLTGNLRLNLNNIFKQGERIKLKWESPGNLSQSLVLGFAYPYLFDSPFGIAFDFKLDKRDTSYLNINAIPAIQFAWDASNYLNAYANIFSSKFIGTYNPPKSGVIDMRSNTFGLNLNINQLDYPFNPRKGYSVQISADAGYKVIGQNPKSETGPDSLNGQYFKFSSQLKLAYYIPFYSRNTILLAGDFGLLQTENPFINELYRIGGSMSLRGFDEQSISAEFYGIATMEYHYLLNQNSYIGLFYDLAQVNNPFPTNKSGLYQGFGINFSFATQAGIFKLAYAIGQAAEENIQFKNAKIHFGYSALF